MVTIIISDFIIVNRFSVTYVKIDLELLPVQVFGIIISIIFFGVSFGFLGCAVPNADK